MEVSVENTGGLTRRMTVQVPAERIESEVESRLQSMSRSMRVDGFRAGKVPLKVVEKKFGRQVRQDVINQVVSATLQEALSKENLRPAGNPAIERKTPNRGEPLEYVAMFEIYPSLQGDIKYDFSVTRPVVEVQESDIDDMLQTLRRQRATCRESVEKREIRNLGRGEPACTERRPGYDRLRGEYRRTAFPGQQGQQHAGGARIREHDRGIRRTVVRACRRG